MLFPFAVSKKKLILQRGYVIHAAASTFYKQSVHQTSRSLFINFKKTNNNEEIMVCLVRALRCFSCFL